MAMAQAIPETVAFPLPSSVANFRGDMDQTLLFTQYRFLNHFKSTTPYHLVHCPIFQHYHPLEAYSPLFVHGNIFWTKYNFIDHCY